MMEWKVASPRCVSKLGRARADTLIEFLRIGRPTGGSRIGAGVVNQKLDAIETVEEIIAKAEAAIRVYGPHRVLLNPDCGFATFADNPVASAQVATAKLTSMMNAARQLRNRYHVE